MMDAFGVRYAARRREHMRLMLRARLGYCVTSILGPDNAREREMYVDILYLHS